MHLQSEASTIDEDAVVSALKDAVSVMAEKRTGIREASLTTIVRSLCMKYSQELTETLNDNWETIWMNLKRSVRKESAKEVKLAGKCMTLLACALSWDNDLELYTEASGVLGDVLLSHSDSECRIEVFIIIIITVMFDFRLRFHLRFCVIFWLNRVRVLFSTSLLKYV